MNIGDLFMRVVADLKGFDADLQVGAKKSGDKAGQTLGKSITASMKKAWSGQELGKGLVQGLGLAGGLGAANALAGGLHKVSDLIGQSIEDASNLNEETSKSEVIFGKNADAIQDWAAAGATGFGLAKRTALEAASGFAGLFATVGEGIDESTKRSKKLTELGADLASFFNTDMPTALAALKSGLSGESEPLRQFNVFLSETAVSAKLAQMGIKKTGGAFTEAQKATARYELILEQTHSAQGDFARTSTGLANAQRILNAELENARAKLGQELLPLQLKVTQAQRDGIPVVLGAVDALENMGTGLAFIGDSLMDATDSWNPFASEAAKTAAAASESGKQIGTSVKGVASDFGLAAAAVGHDAAAFRKSIEGVGTGARTAATSVDTSLNDIVQAFIDARSALESAASDAADAIYGPIVARAELAETEQEIIRQRNLRDAAKAGSQERTDAQNNLDQLNKKKLELLASLAGYGDAAAAKALEAEIAILKTVKNITAGQMASLQALEAQLRRTYLAAAILNKTLPTGGGDLGYGRASGGPVAAWTPYRVGERGEEWFVPDVPGTILPHGVAPSGAAGMVGPTHNWTIYNPEPRAADEDIGRMLRRAAAMGLG